MPLLMTFASIKFDEPDLAAHIEQLSQYDLDRLPFGVILLDRDGTVKFYSATEARRSGCDVPMIGQNLYAIAKCFGTDGFQGRIARASEAGAVDLEFGWTGDYSDRKRDMRIRVQTAHGGGVWIFIDRD
jgi:photoactive yellow protein